LIDDGVEGDGGFAGLAIADDQFALAAANGNHAIDRFQAGLQRLFHGLARDDARRFELDAAALFAGERATAVDGLAPGVADTTDQRSSNRDFGDTAGPFDRIALFDHVSFAEQRRADVIFFQIERHPIDVMGEFQQLAGGHFVETVYAGYAVASGQNRADFLYFNRFFVIMNLFLDDSADFRRTDF